MMLRASGFALSRTKVALALCGLVALINVNPSDADSVNLSLVEDTSSSVSIADSCPVFQLDFLFIDSEWFDVGGFIPGPTSMPQCLDAKFSEANEYCEKKFEKYEWYYVDDCVAGYLVESDGVREFYEMKGIKRAFEPAVFKQEKDIYYGSVYRQATVYLDEACTSITDLSAVDLDSVCSVGTYEWIYSPISLVWDDGFDVDNEFAVAQFPLDPRMEDAWYIWKASAKAPLLVYDPLHLGKITSPSQLFGPWTFGGKGVAMLGSQASGNLPDTRWENGYEALKTLDGNGDGELRGEELSALALWFDENQNGKSEQGEVKLLSDVGVTALFTAPDRQDKATNNLWASRGFERLLGESRVIGASVDWYSDGAQTPIELISRHMFDSSNCQTGQAGLLTASAEDFAAPARKPETEQVGPVSVRDLNGSWEWKFNKEQVRPRNKNEEILPPEGFLSFSDRGDGKISGHSYVEIPVGGSESSLKVKRILSVVRFEGTKTVNAQGQVAVEFVIYARGGTKITSQAELSENGTELVGRSTAKFAYEGKGLTMQYKWTASRKA